MLDSYDDWITGARELSQLGQDMIAEHDVYDSAFKPHTWASLNEKLFELDTAIGEESLHLRNKDLYLPPISYDPSISTEDQQAHAAYRALRESWHDHVDEANHQYFYPYDYDNNTKLMNRVDKLIDAGQLPHHSQQALRILHDDYVGYNNARQDIQTHLYDTDHAIEKSNSFLNTLEKLDRLDVTVDDIDGYKTWRDTSHKLVQSAEDFTEMGDVYCDRYLKENPEMQTHLQTGKDMLLNAIEQFAPSDTKRTMDVAAQHEQLELHQSRGHSIKM